MKFADKVLHPWWACDLTRGDKQCRWVLPHGDGGFLCCTWREGHPPDLPHEIVHDQDEKSVLAELDRWEFRPDASIFDVPKTL